MTWGRWAHIKDLILYLVKKKKKKLIPFTTLFPYNVLLSLFKFIFTCPTNVFLLVINCWAFTVYMSQIQLRSTLQWACSSFHWWFYFARFFLFWVSYSVMTQSSLWSSWRLPMHSQNSTQPYSSLKFLWVGVALAPIVISLARYVKL